MSDKATNGAIKGFINVAPKGGSANCEAAAVGVEGDDGFPSQVVGRQERAHNGRDGFTPNSRF
jgi:hypothetical protein